MIHVFFSEHEQYVNNQTFKMTKLKLVHRLFVGVLALLLLSNTQVLATCPLNSQSFLGANSAEFCVCDSGYYWTGSVCLQNVACITVPDLTDVTTGAQIDSTTLNATLDAVVLDISIPTALTRSYISFQVGNCTVCTSSYSGCYGSLTSWSVTTPNNSSCMDSWKISIPMSSLYACGWTQVDNATYSHLSGSVHFAYSENVTLDVIYSRTLSMALPVELNIATESTAATASNITVVSNFSVSAGIVVRSISTDSSQSVVDLTYMTQYPFQVVSFDTTLVVGGNDADNVTAKVVVAQDYSDYPQPPYNAPNCTNVEYNLAAQSCAKTIRILLSHPGVCRLDGTYTLTGVEVACGSQVLAEDCPVTTPEASSSITFTLLSEYFCSDSGAFNTEINNVVSVQRFISPNALYLERDTNNNVQQNAWQYNTYLWMRMDLDNATLQVTGATLMKVETDWCTPANVSQANFATVYDMTSPNVSMHPPDSIWQGLLLPQSAYITLPPSGALGLDVATQSFLVAHLLSNLFAAPDNATQQACAQQPDPGATSSLRVRLTVDFSYYTSGRRRRRGDVLAAPGIGSPGMVGDSELHKLVIYREDESVPETIPSNPSSTVSSVASQQQMPRTESIYTPAPTAAPQAESLSSDDSNGHVSSAISLSAMDVRLTSLFIILVVTSALLF